MRVSTTLHALSFFLEALSCVMYPGVGVAVACKFVSYDNELQYRMNCTNRFKIKLGDI